MAKKLSPDRTLFVVTIGLVSFGLVMLYSASAVVADAPDRSAYVLLIKQAMWAAVGLLVLLVLMRIDYRHYRRPFILYSVFGMSIAALVLVLFLPTVNDTHRWIRVSGFSFQPSELAKISLTLFLAYQLDKRKERLEDFFQGMLVPLMVIGFTSFLVLIEPDLGSAFCLLMIGFAMLFISGVPVRYLAGLFLTLVPTFFWLIFSAEYRRKRLMTFLDPFEDPLGSGFQIIQSIIAVGTGGIFGAGFMQSQQKHFYLPVPHSDFIFAVIGEELGLVGCLAIVGAFCVLMWRGFAIASKSPDGFGALLASGLTVLIVGQAFVNIGVTIAILPTTGLPLPFISSGGRSLVVMMAAVGLILSVSQQE